MGIKQKLGALLSGGTGIGLLVEGGVDKNKAGYYTGLYNSYYKTDWNKLYPIWEDDPNSALRKVYPTYQSFLNAFNTSFNKDFGYLLKDAAPYQTDATILFLLGAFGLALSGYFLYKDRKQIKQADNQDSKGDKS